MSLGTHHNIMKAALAVSAAAALVAVTAAGAMGATPGKRHQAVKSGTQLWAKSYTGPSPTPGALSSALAASPDGKTVYAVGTTFHGLATVAYSAASGTRRWASMYPEEGRFGTAASIAVSPNGKTVFVAGIGNLGRCATIAYRAATGARLWAKTGPSGNVACAPHSIAVSPDSATVYVTGYAAKTGLMRYATFAYNAATGRQRWVRFFKGPTNGSEATALAVSPNGKRLYVTGWSTAAAFETVAYKARTGARLWAKRYNNVASGLTVSMVISPNGRSLYVAGSGYGKYIVVGYRAANGTRLWARRYGHGNYIAHSIAISPSSKTVFVTGMDAGAGYYLTVAFKAASGARLWAKHYHGPRRDIANDAFAVATSPNGKKVYVTGESHGSAGVPQYLATVAYRAATGRRLWARRHRIVMSSIATYSLAVSQRGGRVFVNGSSTNNKLVGTMVTIAYRG